MRARTVKMTTKSRRGNHGDRPYVAVEEVLRPAMNTDIHDCIVTIGSNKYLVSGWYTPGSARNTGALQRIAPAFIWRGEISVIALGSYVNFLSRISSQQADEAANL
jgi:hypothetical protein